MTKFDKLLTKVLRGTADHNFSFTDLCQLLKGLNFQERIKGDHHILVKTGVAEILNLQPKGGQAKAYQVKQVREVILKYYLTKGANDDQQI